MQCLCVYLIDISQLAVDVLAEFEQQAYGTLIENVQVEEKREEAFGESWVLLKERSSQTSDHTLQWLKWTQTLGKLSLTKTGLFADFHCPREHLHKLQKQTCVTETSTKEFLLWGSL